MKSFLASLLGYAKARLQEHSTVEGLVMLGAGLAGATLSGDQTAEIVGLIMSAVGTAKAVTPGGK